MAGQAPRDAQNDLAWLEQQLAFTATPADSNASFPSGVAQQGPPAESASTSAPIPFQPYAFPPVSQARFHPYQLPPDRAQRILRAPGQHAPLSLLSSAAQLQQLALQQEAHAQASEPAQNRTSPSGDWAQRTTRLPADQGDGEIDWSLFAALAGPLEHARPAPSVERSGAVGGARISAHASSAAPRPTASRTTSTASSVSSATSGKRARPQADAKDTRILYPRSQPPPAILMPDAWTPSMPPTPFASPSTPNSLPRLEAQMARASNTRPPQGRSAKRPRARSAPPPARPAPASAGHIHRVDEITPDRARQLDSLFRWLDEHRWSFSTLFTALSGVSTPSVTPNERALGLEHRRRLDDFLGLDQLASPRGPIQPQRADPATRSDPGLRLLREARRRWAGRQAERGEVPEEKSPTEIARMWEEKGALDPGGMGGAVRELQSRAQVGSVTGSVIRNITNRYGEAYAQAESDIKHLDAALARPPEPHTVSAPREAAVWTGTLVIPTIQAEVLQAWLSDPAHQQARGESQSRIDPEHMRIYSSLSPLDLHARGAELCRALILRNAECMHRFGHAFGALQAFTIGPALAHVDVCGFSAYDESSLWHHAVQTYLQLCVRYPELSEGKEATVVLLPDLPPPAHPTALEAALIDRALHTHWESLRVFLLAAHGGLLRSAVRSFGGVKMSTFDLLCVCDDTRAVLDALGKSRKSRSDRILPYDPSISQIRNAWRQQALWDPTADLVVWSAATTHFLELSALYPHFGRGVRDLPGLAAIIEQKTSPARDRR